MTATDWREQALCRDDPGPWDDDRTADHPHAKRVCARCPVAADCLTDAKTTSDEHGIRAGLTGEQRRVLRLGRLAANRMPAHKWVPIAEEALRADPAGATFATIAAATNRDRTTVNQGLARAGRDDLRGPDPAITPLPSVEGGFGTVLADPPWRFTNRTGKVAPEHRRLDRYTTMTLEAIKELPVEEVAAANAHLYLWVPNALLPDGLAVMQAWGFRYVSNIVWAKRRKDGGPDGRGVGFYFRNVTEMLLFGVRGSMRTLAPARRQVNMIETRKREHSRKPDEQYPLVEQCSPGPHLELFARHRREGWTVWGDESNDEVQPRGRTHRGYAGGPILAPVVAPHGRLTKANADLVSTAMRERYEAGASIRELAAETGYSITRTRALLAAAGTTLRPRGRHRPT